MSTPSLDLIDKVFKKGTKTYLLATEIAARFTGETSSTEVTDDERDTLSQKYGVERALISNVLSGLRGAGLYRDKFYQQRHPPPATLIAKPVATLPTTQQTQSPPPRPASLETPLQPSPSKVETGLPTTPPSFTEGKSLSDETIDRLNEGTTEELRNQIGKQESMINNLQGQLKSVYDLLQRNQSMPAPTSISPAEEVPQVFEYPKDMLVRKVMWFVPKVLTLHQLYVEDAQKKGDVRPPTFVEWVNYMILETYRLRQMDLVLARPPQPVRSGLFGDAS